MIRRADGGVLRIGHKGAAARAPENTLESFEVALAAGVDAIEFDVLDLHDGTLVLAHSDDLLEVSHGAAAGAVRQQTLAALRRVAPALPTLDEALAFFAERAPGLGLHIDLKGHGYERGVVDAVRAHGLVERSFVSTVHAQSLWTIGELEPALGRGLTYPFDRRGASGRRVLAPVVLAALVGLRRTLPLRIAQLLQRADAGIAVLHHFVVSRATVNRCHAVGAPVVAWTVDSRSDLKRMLRAGVDAVVTNDPDLFSG